MSQGSELFSSRIQCIIGSTNIVKCLLVIYCYILQSPKHNTEKSINAAEHNMLTPLLTLVILGADCKFSEGP